MPIYTPNQSSWASEGSAARNNQEIAEALAPYLSQPSQGVLEVASGFGVHALTIAKTYPGATVTPTEAQQPLIDAIVAKYTALGAEIPKNLETPFLFNLDDPVAVQNLLQDPGSTKYTGLLAINLVHIAPFCVAEKLFALASALPNVQWLALYGAYKKSPTEFYSEADAQFEESLKQRNPEWGLRVLDDELGPVAEANGFHKTDVTPMARGNFTVVFTRTQS